MKFLLAAINAKYIHSNPAVYSLRAFANEYVPGVDIQIGEYTINHQMDQILQDIYRRKPDFIGFSCYIWNISYVLELVRDLHKVLPETEIWMGGPEVSYDAGELLLREPDIRGVMRGEGELTFTEVVKAYLAGGGWNPETERLLSHTAGITFRAGSIVPQTQSSFPVPPFSDLLTSAGLQISHKKYMRTWNAYVHGSVKKPLPPVKSTVVLPSAARKMRAEEPASVNHFHYP